MVYYAMDDDKKHHIGPERRSGVEDRRKAPRRVEDRRSTDKHRCLECEYCDQHHNTQDQIHYQEVRQAEHGKSIEIAEKKISTVCKELHDLRDAMDEKIEAVEAEARMERNKFVPWKPFILLMTIVFSAYAGPLAYGVLKMDSIEDNINKLTATLTKHLEYGRQKALMIEAHEKSADIRISNNNKAIMEIWRYIETLKKEDKQ